MSESRVKVAILASTGGSVYRTACEKSDYLRERIEIVVADRHCGAVDAARELGHTEIVIAGKNGVRFSDEVLRTLEDCKIDVAISFLTRLLKGDLLDRYVGRLFNFHPSILPACPGMHGFEDSWMSGARVLGTTVHRIDAGIDTGCPVIQTHFYREAGMLEAEARHRIFVQQCQSLVQLVKWLEAGRVQDSFGFVEVHGALAGDGEFSPALDDADAISMKRLLEKT